MNGINPSNAPHNEKASTDIRKSPYTKNNIPKTKEEIIPSPEESPSMPSIKLKEFIIKSITKIVQNTDEIQESE